MNWASTGVLDNEAYIVVHYGDSLHFLGYYVVLDVGGMGHIIVQEANKCWSWVGK